MSSKYAALEAQLLDATQGGDLLRVRAHAPRRAAAPCNDGGTARHAATQRRGMLPRSIASRDAHAICCWLHDIHVVMRRGVAQMHRLLLNNKSTELVNAMLEGGTRTALHVAVERCNETTVALLLAQCVLRARAAAGLGWAPAPARSAASDVPRAVAARLHRAAKRTLPRPTRTARARWNLRLTATRKASSSC